MSYTYTSSCVNDRMSRARTPFGAVPISTIYGYDYPLFNDTAKDCFYKHENLSDCADYMVRSSRAFSENRLYDPYYSSPAVSSLSFMPSALRVSREMSPMLLPRRSTPVREPTPFRTSSPIREQYTSRPWQPETPRSTSLTFSSTTPWNATGYYHYPRYPESYRGTASTFSPYGRRYFDPHSTSDIYYRPYPYHYFRFPVRRFAPGYSTSTRYGRRY